MANEDTNDKALTAFQKQAQEAAKLVTTVRLPDLSKQAEQLTAMLNGISAVQERAAQAIAATLQTDIWRRIEETAKLAGENLARGLTQIAAVANAVNPSWLQALHKTFEALPAQIRDSVIAIGQRGWYLDPELPLPVLPKLAALFEVAPTDASEALREHFRGRASAIAVALATSFPNRQRVIQKAFDAHARGDYELSIPALLAQADGICQELTEGAQLYSRRRGAKSLDSYIAANATAAFMEALLHPLRADLPLIANEKHRGPEFDELNRHQIMHGEVADYGTEVNSLKAISLINYVAWVLQKH